MTDGLVHVDRTLSVHAFSARVRSARASERPSATILERFQTLVEKLLPLTPQPAAVLPPCLAEGAGRAQRACSDAGDAAPRWFPTLARYIEAIRLRNGRVALVAEHRAVTLADVLAARAPPIRFDEATIAECAYDVLRALAYLHSRGVVVGNLSLRTIAVDAYKSSSTTSTSTSTRTTNATTNAETSMETSSEEKENDMGSARMTWDPFHIKTAAQLAAEAAPRISVLLTDYALCHATQGGALVPFALAEPRSLPPEAVVLGPRAHAPTRAGDVWALGMVVVALVCGEPFCAHATDPLCVLRSILAICGIGNDAGNKVGKDKDSMSSEQQEQQENQRQQECMDAFLAGASPHSPFQMRQNWARKSRAFRDFVRRCLTVDPRARATAAELLQHPLFATLRRVKPPSAHTHWAPFPALECLQSEDDTSSSTPAASSTTARESALVAAAAVQEAAVRERAEGARSLCAEYESWQAAGGDVELDLACELALDRPLVALPPVVRGTYRGLSARGGERPDLLYRAQPVVVPLTTLWDLLACRKSLGEGVKKGAFGTGTASSSTGAGTTTTTAPPVGPAETALGAKYCALAREEAARWGGADEGARAGDMEYLRHRVELFRELVEQHRRAVGAGDAAAARVARDEVLRQARADIPSVLRRDVWMILLGVDERSASATAEAEEEYRAHAAAGPDAATAAQIARDVRRCHQYDARLATGAGRAALARVLGAWVHANTHAGLAYWQGLDSVAAPFVALGLREAQACACLGAFVRAHLAGFYAPDNAAHLARVLAAHRQLAAHADPALAAHLARLGVAPAHYAVPWFATAFAHVFALDGVYRLWDRLLLCPALPFFVAHELLAAQRPALLAAASFAPAAAALAAAAPAAAADVARLLARALARLRASPLVLSLTTVLSASEPSSSAAATAKTTDQDSRWWHQPASAAEVEAELAPRIVLADFVAATSDVATDASERNDTLICDIRPAHEYRLVHYPHAISLPYTSADAAVSAAVVAAAMSASPAAVAATETATTPTHAGRFAARLAARLTRHPTTSAVARRIVRRGPHRLTVVVGTGAADWHAVTALANELVALGVRGVATLNGGMECLLAEAAPLLVTADDNSDDA